MASVEEFREQMRAARAGAAPAQLPVNPPEPTVVRGTPDSVRRITSTPPPIQSLADTVGGVEPAPIPEPTAPIVEKPEQPPAVKRAQQIGNDIKSAVRFQVGLDTAPQGNFPAKAEALRRDAPGAKDITEQGPLEILGRTVRGAAREIKEIPMAVGFLIPLLQEAGAQVQETVLKAQSEIAGLKRTLVAFPDGTSFPIFEPVADMDPRVREQLVNMGARFGPQPDQGPSFLDAVLDGEAERLGFVNQEDVPEDATFFGVPLTDRVFVPREFGEQSADRPISRALDVTLLGAIPRLALKGGAVVSRKGAEAAARVGAQKAEGGLARGSVALAEAANRVDNPIAKGVRLVTRKGVALSPAGRSFLARWDARVMARDMIRENSAQSFTQRRLGEVRIQHALRDLGDDELKLLPAVLEGRAQLTRDGMSTAMENALDTVRSQIRSTQSELIRDGAIAAKTAEDRAWAPLVATSSGHRLPPKGWDRARVVRENMEIQKRNVDLPESSRFPEYLDPDEVPLWTEAHKRIWARVAKEIDLPEGAAIPPIYFPRFPEAQSARDAAREFFPTTGKRPSRVPSLKEFTGLSLFRNVEIADIQQQLFRHNAQVRRVVDSNKLIRDLEGASFTKPLKLDKRGQPIDLLDDHVAYAPDGFIQFYRQQANLSEKVANALDDMGDFEQALAQGVRASFPDGLKVTQSGAMRRTNLLQVPKSVANEINQTFAAVSPIVRLGVDRPLDVWRAGVLAFSPRWHLNNLVGGLVLGRAAGVPFRRLVKPLSKLEKEALPDELAVLTQTFTETYRPNLGSIADTETGRLFNAVSQSRPVQLPTRLVSTVKDKSFGLNQAVDNHFRSRVYLDIARDTARNKIMKDTGRAVIDSREILRTVKELGQDGNSRRALMAQLDRSFVNFNRMTSWERRYMRRVIPFWSWYREIHRVTGQIPFRAPEKAQALRILGEMGKQADEQEVRRHLGIPKSALPEYLQDQVFMGLSNDGQQIQMMSPRGMNVFYGVGMWPIDVSALNPFLQLIAEEAFGGENFGKWGSFAPFRFREAGARFELDQETGELVDRRPFRNSGKRLARTLPLTTFLEDLVQYGTEGVVSQRFADTSPFGNLGAALTGEQITPTAVVDSERRPKRERSLGQVLQSFAGPSANRYRVIELLEQEANTVKRDMTSIVNRKLTVDPEFRRLMAEVLREQAGEPEEAIRLLENRRGNTR